MNQTTPSRPRPLILAVPAVALVVVLAFLAGRLTTTAAPPSGMPAAIASASAGTGASPRPTTTVLPTRTPTPDAGPCEVPAALPPAEAPVAAPTVEASDLAMAFASHLYATNPDGTMAARDGARADWAMGLWFVAPGATSPRLLAEAVEGMVLPLALSPVGDTIAVWWLPERRYQDELACESGIYAVSIVDGSSRLVVRGDWTAERDEEDEIVEEGGIFWADPPGPSTPREYVLPEAAFSTDGRALALAHGGVIDLYSLIEEPRLVRTHLGECADWAWSSVGAEFVAGCEDMTSAWHVDVAEGYGTSSIPIEYPEQGRQFLHDPAAARAIGFTSEGAIRVSRFHGFATGCESPGCTLAPLGWSMTTIDPGTGAAASNGAEVDFLVDAYERHETHLAADASWVYARVGERSGRYLHLGTGTISTGPLLGTIVGSALDGSVLFGYRFRDLDPGALIVAAFDSGGEREAVAEISFPVPMSAEETDPRLPALFVVLPPS